MAQVTITIKDSLLISETKAVAALNGYTDTIPDPANPEQTIPNITREQFLKKQVKAWLRNQAIEFSNREAIANVVVEADVA